MNSFKCHQCSQQLKASDDASGKRVKCPKCGAIVQVPSLATAPQSKSDERPSDSPPPPNRLSTAEQETIAPSLVGGPAAEGDTISPQPKEASGDKDVYDFLAPPQGTDELGRLGAYRILKVLGEG